MNYEKEALRECCIRLSCAHDQVAEMEQVVAQALSYIEKGRWPSQDWQSHARSVLRVLREEESHV